MKKLSRVLVSVAFVGLLATLTYAQEGGKGMMEKEKGMMKEGKMTEDKKGMKKEKKGTVKKKSEAKKPTGTTKNKVRHPEGFRRFLVRQAHNPQTRREVHPADSERSQF